MLRFSVFWIVVFSVLASHSTAYAARFVPVKTENGGLTFTLGEAADISTSMLIDSGQALIGPDPPWDLGDYRLALDTASATIEASIDSQSVEIKTSASLRDTISGNFGGPEANPEVRNLWFHIAPTGNERNGDLIDFHMAMAWQAESSNGRTPQSQARAILSNTTTPDVSPLLFRRSDSAVTRVTIGETYRLSLTHTNLAVDSLVVGSAALMAGFEPMSVAAPAPLLPGDYNLDGTVDAADYTVWRDGLDGPYDFHLDGDGSGTIDAGDLEVLNAWYGSSLPGAISLAIPEPASACVLLPGLLMAYRLRRSS